MDADILNFDTLRSGRPVLIG